MQLQEWRATAARITPWVEGFIQRYDKILDEAAPPNQYGRAALVFGRDGLN